MSYIGTVEQDFSTAASEVFRRLPFDRLQPDHALDGCAARAEVIVNWLNKNHFEAGRIWALPLEGQRSFAVPLVDINGQPFSDGTKLCAWEFHVAATATTTHGKVVFDTLFSGPVSEKTWTALFNPQETEVKSLKYYEAPRYGAFGSHYSPVLAEEHYLDNPMIAKLFLDDLAKTTQSPEYVAPCFRPIQVPRLTETLIQKTR